MKKLLVCLLVGIMICSLFACGKQVVAEENAASGVLRVGFGRRDITPTEEPIPLHGYPGNEYRYYTSVLDPIYATCVAITDEADNTIILFHMDLTSSWANVTAWQRRAVSDATGVPISNISIAATHNHSAPSLGYADNEAYPMVSQYADRLKELMVEAALEAMEDRTVCTMEYGSAYPVGLNFVRHYVMDDGSVVGDNFGSPDGKNYVGHVHSVDNQLQVLRFVREGKQDVVMCNFQTHPHLCGGAQDGRVTADLIAPMRSYLEEHLDCKFIYFTAGAGNVNPNSRIQTENAFTDYVDHGQQLARYAIMALTDTKQISAGKVTAAERDVEVYINSNKLKIRLQVLSAGGLAFGAPPYEMFDTNNKFVKDNSPFEATFMLYLANSSNGYVAEESAYRYGGYEVEYKGYSKGSAEVLADHFVDLLYEIKGETNPNTLREAVPEKE